MMLSSAPAPASQAGGVPVQPPGMHHLPPTAGIGQAPGSSPDQISYEGRLSLLANAAAGSGAPNWQTPPHPFNTQLHFNLLHHQFKPSDDKGPGNSFPRHLDQERDSSPSSSGSPRTDDTGDKTVDRTDEHGGNVSESEERDGRSSLDILQEHINQLNAKQAASRKLSDDDLDQDHHDEEPTSSSPPPTDPRDCSILSSPQPTADLPPQPTLGLTIRRDIADIRRDGEDLRNISEEKEGIEEDFEDDEEELRIDEEMMEEDRDGFEALDKSVDSMEKMRPLLGFQPYLSGKHDSPDNQLNSLQKLQQVLNNRMFNPLKPTEENGNIEHNGNKNDNYLDDNGEYKFILPPDEEGMVYQCHLCSFTGNTRIAFNAHVNSHYIFQCVKCEFEEKSESRYVRHLKEEHNCTPEDLEEAEVRVPRVNSQGKVKTFKCKQCEFVAVTKLEFWKHGRGHIKPEKLLCCPKCIFVTEYKHHLEYHLRNHYGTKPFKCDHCNYSCVNKSMLNSHMKSHTNVYQYRCADCTYATKYCHSLKLHLRKYGHKPAMVLNNDGSPNNLDMFGPGGGGPLGGPPGAGLKRKSGGGGGSARKEDMFPPTMLPQFPGMPPSIMQMQLQHLQSQFGPHPPKLGQMPPFRLDDTKFGHHKLGEASNGNHSPTARFFGSATPEEQIRCDKCEFRTSSKEVFRNHMMLHASSDRTSALHHLLTSPLAAQGNKRPYPELNKSADDLSHFGQRVRSSSPTSSSPRSFASSGLRSVEKSESPPSSSAYPPHMSYLNKLAMHNHPLLQGLLPPNQALRALIEERQKESLGSTGGATSDSSQRDTPDSFASREGAAPLPPNKRHKVDIFSTLYANRMSEQSEKSESPHAALDLSKDNIIGGGSHGSSSDIDTGSNPRSHSSSPALSAGTSKSSRRKGKAYKIKRHTDSEEECGGDPAMPGLVPVSSNSAVDSDHHSTGDRFEDEAACKYCGILFRNEIMHRLHMEYHSYENPFKCQMCGETCDDALAFFLHIAKREHS